MIKFLSIVALICILGGCVPQRTLVSPPLRFALSEQNVISQYLLETCFTQNSSLKNSEIEILQRSEDEYVVQIRGKDLRLSTNRDGVWEEMALSILIMPHKDGTLLLLAGLRGKSTFSRSITPPPPGGRWKSFTDQQLALVSSRFELMFLQVGRCLEKKEPAT